MGTRFLLALIYVLLINAAPAQNSMAAQKTTESPGAAGHASSEWHTQATLRLGLRRLHGVLTLRTRQVEFRPRSGPLLQWRYEEIQTFRITASQLTLTGYANRHWPIPGERSFKFHLATPPSPSVSALLASQVGKPSANARPDASIAALRVLDARHDRKIGGSNGTLRFLAQGIDYVATPKDDSRSWRWADIQTLELPDAYHFRVGGFGEIYDFSLKQPMDHQFFDQLWNQVYGKGLNLGAKAGGNAQ